MADANTEKMLTMATASHEDMMASHMGAELQRGSSQYYSLCKAISRAARPFLKPRARVVDLSARGGDWVEPLVHEAAWQCRFHLFNATEEDAHRCLDRFRMEAGLGTVQEFCLDLNNEFPPIPSDLTICSLILSSFDNERQDAILEGIHKHMHIGGALILVEKERADKDGHSSEELARRAEGKGFASTERIWTCGRYSAWMLRKV